MCIKVNRRRSAHTKERHKNPTWIHNKRIKTRKIGSSHQISQDKSGSIHVVVFFLLSLSVLLELYMPYAKPGKCTGEGKFLLLLAVDALAISTYKNRIKSKQKHRERTKNTENECQHCIKYIHFGGNIPRRTYTHKTCTKINNNRFHSGNNAR